MSEITQQTLYQGAQLPFESLDAIPIPIIVSESIVSKKAHTRVHRYVNKAFTEEIGYSIVDMPDIEAWFNLAYPDAHYREEVINGWTKAIEISISEGKNLVKMTARVCCKSGENKWFNVVANIHTTHLHLVTFIDVHDLKSTIEENERLSLIDPLTSLANRRKAMSFLQQQLSMYNRIASVFSILICDIDHFKAINDEYGHPFGDHVLCSIADVLTETCRLGDCVVRWGGEEFLIILPNADQASALVLAERFRTKVEHLRFSVATNSFNVTMSFGCATLAASDTIDSLLNKADIALYKAKQNGRNQVVG